MKTGHSLRRLVRLWVTQIQHSVKTVGIFGVRALLRQKNDPKMGSAWNPIAGATVTGKMDLGTLRQQTTDNQTFQWMKLKLQWLSLVTGSGNKLVKYSVTFPLTPYTASSWRYPIFPPGLEASVHGWSSAHRRG
jgi:hypothetical protein